MCKPKSSKVILKKREGEELAWNEKSPVFYLNLIIFFSHKCISTTKYWHNYSEAVNKNIICANNLMFSNNTKCIRSKELAKTTKYMGPCLTIQTCCHYLLCGIDI